MSRRKHEVTEYEKKQRLFRSSTERHVVPFEIGTDEDRKRAFFHDAEQLRIFSNACTGFMKGRIEALTKTVRYRSLKREYALASEKLKKAISDSKGEEKWKKRLDGAKRDMTAMQKKFGVTWQALRLFSQQERFGEMCCAAARFRTAEKVWDACEKILFGDGEKLHFRRRGDLPPIPSKQANRTLILKQSEGELTVKYDDTVYHFTDHSDDMFLCDEEKAICAWLANPEREKDDVAHFVKTGELRSTYRPCCAEIICRTIRGRLRVYLHVTVEGRAMPKRRRDGSLRHEFPHDGQSRL